MHNQNQNNCRTILIYQYYTKYQRIVSLYIRMLKSWLLILVFLLLSDLAFGRIDSIEYHVQGIGSAGSRGYPPHWIVSNRYGLFSDTSNNLLLVPGFSIPFSFGKKFKITAGFDAAIKEHIDQSFIYQAYVNLEYGKLKLIAGRQKFTIGQYSERLSVGSFIVSNNALPIPRIGIGFYDYVDVPFTKGYVQVKGALNHGWLEEDRFEYSLISDSYLHEKFAYIRSNKLPFNVHVGIAHMAMYGGYREDGTKVPYDFWSAFFGRGSGVSGQKGEIVNAYGEHLGIFEYGFNFEIKGVKFQFYHQKPINDSGGYHQNFKYNKDSYLGGIIETEWPFIQKFLYEYVTTTYQVGNGTPDPVVDGKVVFPFVDEDREWLEEYYTDLGYDVQGYDIIDWYDFLEDEVNYGYRFGGRVDYYNNAHYGSMYKGRIIGTSLFHTKPQMLKYTGVSINGRYFVNNRIKAHNIGFAGNFIKRLSYWTKITYTNNYGAWQEYEGRYQWGGIAVDPDFDWYYKDSKTQWYSLFEVDYQFAKVKGLSLQAAVAYDFGEIVNNFGGLIGLKYSGLINFKPSKK